jgi:4'-phosphopantetheinyl transferase
MSIKSATTCISCRFDSDNKIVSNAGLGKTEVYFIETKDIKSRYAELRNFTTSREQLKGDKFYFDEDRETYISCHALLRLILSKKLNIDPLYIPFINGRNTKPGLIGNPIYFNITHTREAFALAISRYYYVGIDLEKSSRNIDFSSVIETVFSKREREFILESPDDSRDRFFLIWTRKEALLKSLGTGIITDITHIEVYDHKNIINKSLGYLVGDSVFHEHFIYSCKVLNYFLSVALPQRVEIKINQINGENINSFLD